jgi:hypothetical protein
VRFVGSGGLDIPCQPEVEDLHTPVGGDEDVVGLEVAVDDSRPVCRRQTLGYGRACLSRLAPAERTALEPLAQGLTLEQLGDGVGNALLGAKVVDGEDVWMVESRYGLGFAFEATNAVRVLSH